MIQKIKTNLTYKGAGVDIDAGSALIERIQPFAKRTSRAEVLSGIGGFSALFEVPKRYKNPVLVSGTDGVGTKLKLAFEWNRHETIGQDLVAMSVNDILVQGAEPLFFLDYFACGELDVETAATVIQGIAHGCELSGCALIGGETAEMPEMYPVGEYDLAGFAVGVIEKDRLLDGQSIVEGDAIIGLASSGLHSNGYALVRRVIKEVQPDVLGACGPHCLMDALMMPTRIYVKPIRALLEDGEVQIKGMAHITGGGLIENIPRILKDFLSAHLDSKSWERPAVFDWLGQWVSGSEMYRVFNDGIGMVVVVSHRDVDRVLERLLGCGQEAWRIGEIVERITEDRVLIEG